MNSIFFPNETGEYRSARDRLLEAEISLRRQIESVAEQRRALPMGGVVKEDYVFEGRGGKVKMSDLFTRGDTLVAYSFMYGPKMEHACPMCTSMLDSLDAGAPHIKQQTALVVVARSPLPRVLEHASARGWRNLELLSSSENSYNVDYHAEAGDGSQLPMLNVFVRRSGEIRHFWASEMLFAGADAGQNTRHVDMIWPLWNLLDVTPEGRGSGWFPKLQY